MSLLLFEGIILFFILNRPLDCDELHYVNTIKQFGEELSISTIKHYNEMSTPLPFILYSTWGRIFNYNIQTLRIFSVIIAIITYLLFHRLIYSMFNDNKIALLTTAYIVLNPYMVGLSVLVFTDMLSILFIIISCIAIRNNNPIILSISLAGCLLCRQYLIFFVLAVGLYYFIKYYNNKSRDNTHIFLMLLSCIISLIPLSILVFLWKGLSPINELKNVYLDEGLRFHPSFFNLYVSQLFVYLAPLVVIFWKSFYNDIKIIFGCFIISWFYWLYPIRVSKYQVNSNIYTVGLFHKFIRSISGSQFIENVIFYLAFFLGLPIIVAVVKDLYFKLQKNIIDFALLLDLSIVSFLLIMPFSYYCWEKYFLPILPLAVMRILLIKYSDSIEITTR